MISVSCKCGKKFRTDDSHAGKRARCPGCGAVLTIPAPHAQPAPVAATPEPVDDEGFSDLAALAAAGGAEVFQPSAAPASTKSAYTSSRAVRKSPDDAKPSPAAAFAAAGRRQSAGPTAAPAIRMLNVSPLHVIGVLVLIAVPALIYWVKTGPVQAVHEWDKRSKIAQDQIPWQVCRAVSDMYSSSGAGMDGLAYQPKVTYFSFADPAVMLSLPSNVLFVGRSTEGPFTGTFHPRTWMFEADLTTGGKTHRITGNASQDDNSLEIDGKKLY